MKKIYATLLLTTISAFAFAQTGFAVHYGGPSSNQFGYAIKQCFDGGYIASGSTTEFGYWYYLVRMDSLGDTLWTRKYADPQSQNRVAFDVIQTHDSCFVLCGYENSSSPKVSMMKVDPNGNVIWQTAFGGGSDWAQSVQELPNHEFILAGAKLYKTDSAGNMNWSSTSVPCQFMYVTLTADGGYAACGWNGSTIYLTKRDSANNFQWTKTYNGKLFNCTNNVLAATSDGGYAITGQTATNTSLFIKTDANGDTVFTRNLVGYNGAGVVETAWGGYAVATGDDSSPEQMFLTILDGGGTQVHFHAYGYPTSDEWPMSIDATSDSGFVICGTGNNFPGYIGEMFVVKTDSTGGGTLAEINPYVQNNSWTLYPNPTNDRATLHFDRPITNGTMDIFSATGELVFSKKVSGMFVSIERNNQPAGIYFVNITTEEGTVVSERIVFTD